MSKEKKYEVLETKLDENGKIEYEKSTWFIMFKFAKAYANNIYNAKFGRERYGYSVSVIKDEEVLYTVGGN